jgi:hypothetical protein
VSGKSRPGNPNDEIRERMLRYFYDRAQKSRSKTGKYGYAMKISDVKADLKEAYGYSQQQVLANLRYLVDRGWVRETQETKQVPTRGGMVVPSTTTFYEVSAEGTDRIEGGSAFEPPTRFEGINIEATGTNVITLGDGNAVNVEFQQLFNDLSDLRAQLISSPDLTDEQKLSVAVDIDTLKGQLASSKPDAEIASRLWNRIERAANIAGLAAFATELGRAIAQLAS